MRLVLVGAGSVGLTLAARLGRGGRAPRIVTRRPEAAAALRERGVRAEHAGSGERFEVPLEAFCWDELPPFEDEDLVVACVRGSQLDDVADRLLAYPNTPPILTFVNGIGHEERLATRLPEVVGGVWRETCTRVDDVTVRFLSDRPARVIVGRHPEGDPADQRELGALLERGDLDVGLSSHIQADKWLKLCINVMSTPNALVRREDHATEAFVELKVRLLEEARDALRAAGIEAASCDGRDRSLDEEIEFQRGALGRGTAARRIALYNQVWTALTHGGPVEADSYHALLIETARAHGVPTPTHEATLRALQHAIQTEAGPESASATDLLP